MAKTQKIIASTEIALIGPVQVPMYEPTAEEMALGEEMAARAERLEFFSQNNLAEIELPATSRVTAENIIVPAGELGSKERWFIKKNLHDYQVTAAKTVVIVATKRQLKDRGINI